MPDGVPITIPVERPEEFAPGADPELIKLIHATADMEMAAVSVSYGPVSGAGAPPIEPGTGLVDKVKDALK